MNKMIVAVFKNETNVFNALNALKQLHKNGDISIYSSAVIEKNQASDVSLKTVEDDSAENSVVGLVSGALVGMLAGPAGMLVGASLGGLTGAFFDLDDAGISAGFASEVSEALLPNHFAIVMEVEENWTTPVNTVIAQHDGIVFRKLRDEVAEAQLKREVEATEAELQELDEEFERANEETKASIKKQIESNKQKLSATQEQIAKRVKKIEQSNQEKLATLESQLETASERTKQKINKRIEKVKENYQVQQDMLDQAARENYKHYYE
ncbi:DUF1269 domain-containing protein [Alginatibacterium sediminis]|nr:DUF1269 domain-containing protein [Alginatibacterium sediminis]